MKNCNCQEEIPRDGSGQFERNLKALDPSYVPVDGRSIEDLLVFARNYASLIHFYDIPESSIKDGISSALVSWQELFRRDMAVIAASIANTDLAKVRRDYEQNRTNLDMQPSGQALKTLFDQIITQASEIDAWYTIAIPDNPLYADLALAIQSSLANQVQKIIAYSEAYQSVELTNPLNLDYSAIKNTTIWGIDSAITADATIYQGATLDDKIRYAALYVDDCFGVMYAFLTDLVVVKSPGYLTFALQAYPKHQPHMALFITFLELFRLAQDQMNQISGRMLDFYYQDVLRLSPKPAIPDRVYMIFELAKDIVAYDLPQATALKAGKDAAGKEQIYTTATDLVINQAKVKELKTIFIQKSVKDTKTITGIYARSVANSQDGFGAPFTDPSGKWPTFGKGDPATLLPKNICQSIAQAREILSRKDQSKIGFAIASPQLVLQGGNRLLVWESVVFNQQLFQGNIELEISLTGDKGWVTIPKLTDVVPTNEVLKLLKLIEEGGIFPAKIPQEGGYFLDVSGETSGKLYIYLPVSADAIIAFDGNLHTTYRYQSSYPVLQLLLGPKLDINFDQITKTDFTNQTISVWVGSINQKSSLRGKAVAAFAEVGTVEALPVVADLPFNQFDGLKKLVLQNDNGLLDANKPFDPFTLYPNNGKSLYIGSSEVFNKPLDKLAIDIKCTQNTPYISYNLSVLTNRSWLPLLNNSDNVRLTSNVLVQEQNNDSGNQVITPISLDRTPINDVQIYQPQSLKGFIQLELNLGESLAFNSQDFAKNLQYSQALAPLLQIKEISVSYHSVLDKLDPDIDQFFHVYPFGVTEILLAPADTNVSKIENDILTLTSLEAFKVSSSLQATDNKLSVNARNSLLSSFSYLNPASVLQNMPAIQRSLQPIVINPSTEIVETQAVATKPISYRNALIYEASGLGQILKGANNQYSCPLQEQGILYIGLEKLQPLDSLSLLFQFAEGSAQDEDNDPPAIHWSYLSCNNWQPLPVEKLISDGTFGFQATGIVKIEVPADITNNNTVITDGLYWFAASVSEYSERIPMLINVVAQAVEAQFQDNGNLPSHFDSALTAGSVSKLAIALPQVAKVAQPFASFDGKHREIGKEFYTRVSERLRHKSRAVTAWDYEHLVLYRFPGIYKVKCITHSDPNCFCRTAGSSSTCCGPQIAPGHVLIIPIADLKNRNAVNPLQPKTSRRTLLDIQSYLCQLSSPFVKIRAKNPLYEQVLVAFKVQFLAGSDTGYYLKKLNDELVQYLTPWAFDEYVEVSFVQKIYASAIINFIEKRPYVDFITDFLMFVCLDKCCPPAIKTQKADDSETPVSLSDMLSKISSCCDLENLIASGDHFQGKVIAEPSSSHSILVSAPKHIILPYQPPPIVSPCDQLPKILVTSISDETQNLWPEPEN